jgi:hypothetical protein
VTRPSAKWQQAGITKRDDESWEDYEQRCTDTTDARKARRFFFVRHHSVELIAKILDRPEQWVREIVQYKRLPVI